MIHERNEDTDNSLAEGGQRVVSLFLLGCIEEAYGLMGELTLREATIL